MDRRGESVTPEYIGVSRVPVRVPRVPPVRAPVHVTRVCVKLEYG